MKKIVLHIILLAALLFGNQRALSQQAQVDSMQKILASSGRDTIRLFTLNMLSRTFRRMEDYDKAMQSAADAKKLAEEMLAGSPAPTGRLKYKVRYELSNAWNSMGEIERNRGNYPAAMEDYLHLLKISEELGLDRGMATAYNNIGIIYVQQGNFTEALKNHELALSLRRKIADRNGMASSYNNLGAIYASQQNYPRALDNYLEALHIFEKMSDRQDMAKVYNNIGIIYEKTGLGLDRENPQAAADNYLLALRNYENSSRIKKELNDRQGISVSDINIGNILTYQGKYPEAERYFSEAVVLGRALGFRDGVKEAYHGLSVLMEKKGDYKNAYRYNLLFTGLKDSLVNEEGTKKITQMELRFRQEKLDSLRVVEDRARALSAEVEKQKQRAMLNAVLAGLFLVSVLAFFIFRSYRQKQKANVIITGQKEEVEQKNVLLKKQKELIEEKNKDITDSINYAKRIQDAILPGRELGAGLFPDSFILFQPRDIVSGDFYWFAGRGTKKIIAAVDCTGHGVPGAFMSMIGNAFLNEIVNEKGITTPGEILSELRHLVIKALKQTGMEGEQKDGMDISLLCFDADTLLAEWAGANNPLWLVRNGQCITFNPDKRPIGFFRGQGLPFTNHEVPLQKGDTLYIFTDGYADQFGGPAGKKFKYRALRELLCSLDHPDMAERAAILRQKLQSWMNWPSEDGKALSYEQVDDVLVIGIRI